MRINSSQRDPGPRSLIGTLENNYRDDLTETEAIQLAYKAMKSAIERNPFTGNGIDAVIISKEGFKRLTDAELLKINEVTN